MKYKILVVSDSHGNNNNIIKALNKQSPVDMLIHCGDMEQDIQNSIGRRFNIDIYYVTGNCDFCLPTQKEIMIRLENHRILVVHGHEYGVKRSTDSLLSHAKSKDADIVLYGHSHVPNMENRDGVLILNPGSISYPRQFSRNKTYAVLTLNGNKKPKAEIFEIED